MITVKNLIEKLQQLDPDIYVFISGYEGGYNNIEIDDNIIDIALNVNTEWWYGKHSISTYLPDQSKYKIVKGVLIKGEI